MYWKRGGGGFHPSYVLSLWEMAVTFGCNCNVLVRKQVNLRGAHCVNCRTVTVKQ
jgi:hypothetical protein